MKKYLLLSTILASLLGSNSLFAAQTPTVGPIGSIQIDKNGYPDSLKEYTSAAYKANTTIMNGISVDPRAFGALCAGYNLFSGNGSTTTFNYTIPFTGSSPTDNTNFMVFYEPSDGTGNATILNTTQFSVTGVNSGSGGTITLNSPPPSSNTLVVVHDDAVGIIAAATSAVASGGYVQVPTECTIYGNQSNGTVLPEGANLIGQGFSQNYTFQGTGMKPILRVIAPTNAGPNFGFNISGKNQQFFEGFEVTTNVPGNNSLGFLGVPVLIGANGSGGAGGGQNPGIVLQYMTLNSGKVGFGAPMGGNSNYIFAAIRFSNFTANEAGIYGPLSDFQIIGNDFASNGGFGPYGSVGGMVIGPNEGAPGAAGAGRIIGNRFEFNKEGIVVQSGTIINMEGNQFDGNNLCGIDLNTFWSNINITGGWFRGNANNGAGGSGSTVAGQDAHICFNGGANSTGLHLSNVEFLTSYSEGNIAPLGSANATTPPYVLDFNTSGSQNEDVEINGGDALGVTGNNGAYVTDFAIFRAGKPTKYKINVVGQAAQGNLINGQLKSQIAGIPPSIWNSYVAYGDGTTIGSGLSGTSQQQLAGAFTTLVGNDFGAKPTIYDETGTWDSNIVNDEIYPNANPNIGNNPMAVWLPSINDPTYGGTSTPHRQIIDSIRQGALAWMTIPPQFKVYGQNSSCVKFGTWTNDSAYGGNYGIVSNTNGNTLTCTIATNGGPLYAWYKLKENDGGTFTYSIDGGPTTSLTTNASNIFSFPVNSHTSVAFIRVPMLSTGSHTIVFNVTSTTNSSNTVTIEGIGTTPSAAYYNMPSVFIGGQLYQYSDANSAITAAYDTDIRTDVHILESDGLNVHFVDVRKYVNSTTDIINGGATGNLPTSSGQQHLYNAFEAALQFEKIPNNAGGIDPRNYGAVCNSTFLDNNFNADGTGYITTTANSPIIGVNGYTFSSADIGKYIAINGGSGNGDLGVATGTILSVNTGTNQATLSVTPTVTANNGFAIFGHDDTAGFAAASAVAAASGGYVYVPNNCSVRELSPVSNTTFKGGVVTRGYASALPSSVPALNILSTGYSEDSSTHFGINLHNTGGIGLYGFTIQGIVFPYVPFGNNNLTLVGSPDSNLLAVDGVYLDHMTLQKSWVGLGGKYGTVNSGFITFQSHNSEYITNAWGIYGQFEDSASFNDVFTGNWGAGAIDFFGNATRFVGDRFEENPNGGAGAAIILENGAIEINFDACQWQFNGGYGLQLNGNWKNININGGWFEGNGVGNATGHRAHIALNGTTGAGGGLHITGVVFDSSNFAFGGTTQYIIDGITSGSFNPNIDIIGGGTVGGYTTALANWEVSTPTNFRIETVDTTRFSNRSEFSTNASGNSAFGATSADADSKLQVIGALTYKKAEITKTANYNLLSTDSSKTYNNTGASGSVSWTSPTASTGLNYCIYADIAQPIIAVADTGHTIRSGANVTSSGGNFTSDGNIGSYLCWEAINNTSWIVTKLVGTWNIN